MSTAKERSQAHPEGALSDLLSRENYRVSREHVFPSYESLRYFINKHRAILFERGALHEIGGRVLVRASAFDAAIFDLTKTPRQCVKRATA